MPRPEKKEKKKKNNLHKSLISAPGGRQQDGNWHQQQVDSTVALKLFVLNQSKD